MNFEADKVRYKYSQFHKVRISVLLERPPNKTGHARSTVLVGRATPLLPPAQWDPQIPSTFSAK